jgi:hypothetical protein
VATRVAQPLQAEEADVEAVDDTGEEARASQQVVRDNETESAVAASILPSLGIEAELYDSGASCHVCLFRDKFVTCRTTPPRAIVAADKRVSYAVGVGGLNERSTSEFKGRSGDAKSEGER